RPVRELERTAAHSGGDAAAGHLLLGPRRLSARRLRLPGDRHGNAGAARSDQYGVAARSRLRAVAHRGRGRGRTIHLGLSGDLSAALVEPIAAPPRSAAALAV